MKSSEATILFLGFSMQLLAFAKIVFITARIIHVASFNFISAVQYNDLFHIRVSFCSLIRSSQEYLDPQIIRSSQKPKFDLICVNC